MDAHQLQRVRTVPLEAVLEGFGAQRDPKDPRRNWRAPGHRITVTGERFFDHDSEVGGGGAIDLALHLMGRNPRRPTAQELSAAARWLGAMGDAVRSVSAAPPSAPVAQTALGALEPAAHRVGRVRWYLTQSRAMPAALVDHTIRRGDLFADRFANAVFQLRDATGQTIGYEKRGTYDKPFHAVHGEKGLFFTGSAAHGTAAFVESAIEALSYRALHPDVLAVSTTGNAIDRPHAMALHLRERGLRIVAAFNADTDGDRFAARFAQRLGGPVERDRPEGAKDWNALLQQLSRQGRSHEAPRATDRSLAWTR
jgi:hypothetical protein